MPWVKVLSFFVFLATISYSVWVNHRTEPSVLQDEVNLVSSAEEKKVPDEEAPPEDEFNDKIEKKQVSMQSQLIQEKIKRLEEIQKKLNGGFSEYQNERKERLSKIVNSVEKMRPQAAAEFMEALSEKLAISIMAALSTEKRSKIMNLMSKEKLAGLAEGYMDHSRSTGGKK